jgi:hypothetical protein
LVALVVAVVAAVAGAFGAGLLATRLTALLGADRRARVARRCVVLLSGLAGAEIATQLVELVRQLESDHGIGAASSFEPSVRASLDAVNLAIAFHEVLFTGGLLIGLAAVIGGAAMRKYGNTQPEPGMAERAKAT